MHSVTDGVSGLYLRSVQKGRIEFGDRGTRVEGEVVVHATVVELDVCVTRVFGDGRRTWYGVVLTSLDLSVPILATAADHVFVGELGENTSTVEVQTCSGYLLVRS